jgi:hypothetical protein
MATATDTGFILIPVLVTLGLLALIAMVLAKTTIVDVRTAALQAAAVAPAVAPNRTPRCPSMAGPSPAACLGRQPSSPCKTLAG